MRNLYFLECNFLKTNNPYYNSYFFASNCIFRNDESLGGLDIRVWSMIGIFGFCIFPRKRDND